MNKARRRVAYLVLVTTLALLGSSCSGHRSAATENITGVTWEWTQTSTPEGVIVASAPRRYTIRLKQNGEAQIRYDCNHGGSLYEISKTRLSLGDLTYTRVPCHEGSQGIMYRQQLGAVTTYHTQDGYLFLRFPGNAGTMRFRKKANDI